MCGILRKQYLGGNYSTKHRHEKRQKASFQSVTPVSTLKIRKRRANEIQSKQKNKNNKQQNRNPKNRK